LNVRLLHSDSLAAGHLGVSDGQSESESELKLYEVPISVAILTTFEEQHMELSC